MNVALSELPRSPRFPSPAISSPRYHASRHRLPIWTRAYSPPRGPRVLQGTDRRDADPSTSTTASAGGQPCPQACFCQHFPYDVRGGWDARRDEAADAIIAHVDRFRAGFKASVIGGWRSARSISSAASA